MKRRIGEDPLFSSHMENQDECDAAESIRKPLVNHVATLTSNCAKYVFMAYLMAMLCACSGELPGDGDTEKVQLGGQEFQLELAMSNDSRTRGLGGRTELAEDGGMLFIFPNAISRGFWMYDCLMDIDIAFIDPLGHVTAIHTMPFEPPQGENESIIEYESRLPRYRSGFAAQYAIELRPGKFEELGISKGDRLKLNLGRLKALAKRSETPLEINGSR